MSEFDFTEYRLKFKQALNLVRTATDDVCPLLFSDWLYKAVASAYKRLLGKDMPADKLAISSAFPYFKKQAQVLAFSPKDSEFILADRDALLLKNALRRGVICWRLQVRQRAAFNRLNLRRALRFSAAEIYFKEGAGFWLGARFADENTKKEFESALCFLGDEGIGSAKTAGYGAFEIAEVNDIKIEPSAEYALLALSRYLPEEQILKNDSFFIKLRSVSQPVMFAEGDKQYRKEILFAGEGSLINPAKNFDFSKTGEIFETTLEKRIGRLFALPVTKCIFSNS